MDKFKEAQLVGEALQEKVLPSEATKERSIVSSFIIVDLEEQDEGSFECCRVC